MNGYAIAQQQVAVNLMLSVTLQKLVCAAFAIGEGYNLSMVRNALKKDQSLSVSPLPQGMPNK
jgi:hypothetical protein